MSFELNSRELDVTTGRLETLDIARGLSVVIMIMVHTLWMYGSVETQTSSWVGVVLHILGKGTAAFLLLMGFSMALSRRQLFKDLMIRGSSLLLLGYLLNVLKFIIPIYIFGTMPDSFIGAYGWQEPLSFTQMSYLVLTGDILQLAGLSLLIIALIRAVITKPLGYFVLAILVAVVSSEIRGFRVGHPVFDYILDILMGAHFNIYFPVFPWISCILVGLGFGVLYREHRQKTSNIFGVMAIFGVCFIGSGLTLMMYDSDYHFNDFFHLGPGGAFYLIGINCVALWLIHQFLQQKISHIIRRPLIWCSERVTSLYVIQWTLICWGMGIIGFKTLAPLEVVAMIPVSLSLTIGLRIIWDFTYQKRLEIFEKTKAYQS
ncbi:heparan-alpha-glucosaminide N-acetyltransferase domain-containing protein [Pleionea sediminis]|uniref:heparan-alpha-glucosaminide N-acetyltransferase domain-containing protein n=1 Tax=Pleionea sediminis TaxID=2569479 RepID=UPI0011871E88|nr:heparan-alpha-glucosaminide N-acetyltransferase domain-containing protein [Pleionea sediminis]